MPMMASKDFNFGPCVCVCLCHLCFGRFCYVAEYMGQVVMGCVRGFVC